jgi:hypothetical protein
VAEESDDERLDLLHLSFKVSTDMGSKSFLNVRFKSLWRGMTGNHSSRRLGQCPDIEAECRGPSLGVAHFRARFRCLRMTKEQESKGGGREWVCHPAYLRR